LRLLIPPEQVKSKNEELQTTFFNGLGYETWENVWGTWNGADFYSREYCS